MDAFLTTEHINLEIQDIIKLMPKTDIIASIKRRYVNLT